MDIITKVKIWNTVICAVAIILIVICVSMFMQIDDRVVMHVDNFEMTSNTQAFTVGDESDVCFDKVPHDYLEVFVEKDSIRWQVNERYRNTDSLWYYKINDKNPNLHDLSEDDRITISFSDGESEAAVITVRDISEMLKGVDNQYVMLRYVLGKKQVELDTTFQQGYDFFKDRGIKSFVYRNKEGLLDNKLGKCQLVILDDRTTLYHDNKEIRYAVTGSDSRFGGKAKVQFFRMTPAAYMEKKVKREYFAIKSVNYIAKPVVVSTEWGAGHVLVERNEEDKLICYFPKPITYVERVEELKSASEKSSGLLTYRQDDGGFPTSNMLSIPAFSSQVSADICNLRFSGDTIFCDNRPLRSSHCFPTFEKATAGVNGEISVRVGLLDGPFLWSCITVPLFFLFLCVVLMLLMLLPKINYDNTKEHEGRWMDSLPTYMPAIFLIYFAYIICKVMIAMKLGFTYPYFENVFGVNMVSVCLMLLLVLGISSIINWKFIVADRSFSKPIWRKNWPWLFPVLYLVGLIVMCAVFDKMNDTHFYSVLRSYLPGDVNTEVLSFSSWKICKWGKMNGMNDTFFNIPYALLLANFIMLVTTVLVLVFREKLCEVVERGSETFEKWDWWKKMLVGVVAILLLRFLSGNFATAFITFLVIVFMSGAFRTVKLGEGMSFSKAMVCYLGISLSFIIVSCWGGHDFGYITNFVGFIFFIFFVYIITQKTYGANKGPQPEKEGWVAFLTTLVVVLLFYFVTWLITSYSDINSNRSQRRVNLLVNWEEYSQSGKRYAESDAEFVRVMQHYMFNGKECIASDPLSNDEHILHPSVSTGQASVVQNDVSIQGCFFGAYGWSTYVVYFGLLALLCWLIVKNAVYPVVSLSKGERENINIGIGRWVYWRTLAMFMWVGTSLYLFLSYCGVLPFTGRLNPGFGVDSVGEALETSILIAFMLASNPYKERGES